MSFDAVRLTELGRVSSVVPSPDGSWLAVIVQRPREDGARYVGDLWRVELTGSDAPTQLTRGNSNDSSPAFRSDGALGFISKRSPDEHAQIWLLSPRGGDPQRLTDEPLGVLELRFAADADRMLIIAPVLPDVAHDKQREAQKELDDVGPSALHYTDTPIRHWDHWLPIAAPHVIAYRQDGSQRSDLTPSANLEHRGGVMGLEWAVSRDGSKVALPANRPGDDRILDSSMRVIDVASGEPTDLGVGAGITNESPIFSPDGERLVVSRHHRVAGECGNYQLWTYDLGGNKSGSVVAPDWDVWAHPAEFIDDDNIVATAETGGYVPVFRISLADGKLERLVSPDSGGSHTSVHVVKRDGEAFVVGSRSRILHPPEPFAMPLAAHATPQLVASLSGFSEEQGSELASWESLTTPGDGGTDIQWFLVKPKDASEPCPALLWIHGGPMSQHADNWHWRWNALVPVAAGYAVALPNPRGSTGFGQSFVEGVWNNEWGAACYRDLMAVTDDLVSRDDIDTNRIAAMGGSFGGYMANWIGGQTNRFRALISHAGIFHLPAFHGATDYPAYFQHEMGSTPYDDPETFDRYSPHRFLRDWKTPTLIIHGERDFRVPISEALIMFEGLRMHDVEAELLVFPDENHWILKPRNAREWYEKFLAFLAKHM